MRRMFWVCLGIGMGAAAAYVVTRRASELIGQHPELAAARDAGQKVAAVRGVGQRIRLEAAAREAELREALGMPDDDEDAQARERWAGMQAERATRQPGRRHRPSAPGQPQPHPGPQAPATRPGGLQPGDLDDPLYEF